MFFTIFGIQIRPKNDQNLINRKKLQNLGPLSDLKFFRVEKWSQNGLKIVVVVVVVVVVLVKSNISGETSCPSLIL